METLAIIYFAYMFISFYLLILTLLLYFKNRDTLFYIPPYLNKYKVSVIVPVFNEEKTIEKTIKHLFDLDYNNIIEVLAVNDGSVDRTLAILKNLQKKYSKLKILNKQNSGKADSVNKALKISKGELILIVDADSYPDKDSLSKLIGFFNDEKVGAATAACVPRNRSSFLEKLQLIEYKVIAFTRKLLEYVDSIYVTPGSMSVYRKKALVEIGGFDTNSMTEDIEATWHLIHNKWKIKMCLASVVTTQVPDKIKPWFKQRRRWAVGGYQCISKYKSSFLKNKGMLGYFVLPFFTVGLALSMIGMIIFVYVFAKRFIREYLILKFSVDIGAPILTMNELMITPSVLVYFGLVLFFLFFFFTLFVLSIIKDRMFEKQNIFILLFYTTIYLMVYPIALLVALDHFIRGKKIWR